MLYNRSELREQLLHFATENFPISLLLALGWLLSHFNPNLISGSQGDRIGLLQVNLTQAQAIRHNVSTADLLDPIQNIRIAIQILNQHGLLVFLGREFAPQLPSILRLQAILESKMTNQSINKDNQ